MDKRNCWEVMKCGREPGGEKADELGICPAALAEEIDGVNDGKNGGRICWAVAGTLCDGECQGTFAQKLLHCVNCEFMKQVTQEEGREFKISHYELKKKNGK